MGPRRAHSGPRLLQHTGLIRCIYCSLIPQHRALQAQRGIPIASHRLSSDFHLPVISQKPVSLEICQLWCAVSCFWVRNAPGRVSGVAWEKVGAVHSSSPCSPLGTRPGCQLGALPAPGAGLGVGCACEGAACLVPHCSLLGRRALPGRGLLLQAGEQSTHFS